MRLRKTNRDSPFVRRGESLAFVIWTSLSLAAVVVLSRRLTGFTVFPPPLLVVLVTMFGYALSIVPLFLQRKLGITVQPGSPGLAARTGLFLAVTLPPLILGLSLTAPNAAAAQMAIVTQSFAASVIVLLITSNQHGRKAVQAIRDVAIAEEDSHCTVKSMEPAENIDPLNDSLGDESIPDGRSDWMSRTAASEQAGESVEGLVTVRFSPGEKVAVVHVAFCPPLPGVPSVECEPTDGADIQWKVAVAQPYGLRIDVRRRTEIVEPLTVPLAYFASAAKPQRNAA